MPENTPLKGEMLPTFNLLLSDSSIYLSGKDAYVKKPVVLLLFGPNCPYSRAQMEEIIDRMSSLKDIRFYIFTVGSFEEFKDFYKNYGLNRYPNIIAGTDYSNFFVSYFKATGVPFMAIYDKNRKLKEAFIGKVDGRQIKKVAEN